MSTELPSTILDKMGKGKVGKLVEAKSIMGSSKLLYGKNSLSFSKKMAKWANNWFLLIISLLSREEVCNFVRKIYPSVGYRLFTFFKFSNISVQIAKSQV